MPLPPIGFIGLGAMGRGMALNLVKEVETVYVCDMSADAVKILTDAGAVACTNPSEVAQKTSTIMICVPDAPQVRTILFGDGGVSAAGKDDLTIIDCTTMDRADAETLHGDAGDTGMAYWLSLIHI